MGVVSGQSSRKVPVIACLKCGEVLFCLQHVTYIVQEKEQCRLLIFFPNTPVPQENKNITVFIANSISLIILSIDV